MTAPNPDIRTGFDPDGRMELIAAGARPGHGAAVDFRRVTLRGISSQPLVRACAERGKILDATTGLGGDTWILAAAGFSVTAVERSQLVHQVLHDGLVRARGDSRLATIAARIELHHCDAVALLRSSCQAWSAIYLDPMYPPKPASALAPKPIRLVRDAVGDDVDSMALFLAAVDSHCGRIVVKRPHHAQPLYADPDIVLKSKLVRYDVYVREGSSLRSLRQGIKS